MTLTSQDIHSHVSFEVHPSSILGENFKNVRVLAILDPQTALHFIDIQAMHANVFPTLPGGTPDDPFQYEYVKVRRPDGNDQVLGLPWIDENTIVYEENSAIVITIENVSPEKRQQIANALSANGFTAKKIEVLGAND